MPFGEPVDLQAQRILEAQLARAPEPLSSAIPEATTLRSLFLDDKGRALPWALPFYRIAERCTNTIRVLQEIPRDPDHPNDVDPDYTDDHPHDMVGFAVASREYPAEQPVRAAPEHQHPGLRRDGTRKSREWTEEDEVRDWLGALGKSTGGRYGRRGGS